jgi:integrase
MFPNMNRQMKNRYRVFLRPWGVYYCEDLVTGKQETLKTRDREEAARLVAARNENEEAPAFSLHLARVYWKAGDPAAAKRTWEQGMEEIPKFKTGDTQRRWLVAIKDKAFDPLRDLVLLETQAEHFLRVLENGCVSTNVYLRRIHNFALDMNWLPWPVLPKKRWPAVNFKKKQAITWEQHSRIVEREGNAERRAFYQLAWHTGASQTDLASLEASNIDWERRALSFTRRKTNTAAILRFDDAIAEVLRSLPAEGPLFPYLRTVRAGDRATEFKQRCDGLKIKGVTLHSYRCAWAQRARKAGYPERFAMENLGHNSKAAHWAYAGLAQVEMPSLGEYERNRATFLAGALRAEAPAALAG